MKQKKEMKEIAIANLDNTSINSLAGALRASKDGLRVRLGNAACCPHYIVPIYALIDYYRSRGVEVEVLADEHSTEASIFRAATLERPFGSVWRFDNQDALLELFNATQKEILRLPNIGKGFKTAFGWCLSEDRKSVV